MFLHGKNAVSDTERDPDIIISSRTEGTLKHVLNPLTVYRR